MSFRPLAESITSRVDSDSLELSFLPGDVNAGRTLEICVASPRRDIEATIPTPRRMFDTLAPVDSQGQSTSLLLDCTEGRRALPPLTDASAATTARSGGA